MVCFRTGKRMKEAEDYCQRKYCISLKEYLRRKTNSGISDIELGREFGVTRHTIRNWKTHLQLVVVKRALSEHTTLQKY